MKAMLLQPFKEAPPPERESCRACRTFVPDLLVPMGDEAVPMCWLCAHHVVDHDVPMRAAAGAQCECSAQQIYPHRVFTPVEPAAEPEPEKTLRELEREQLLKDPRKLTAWAIEAHKQMSISQHAAVMKRLKRSA